MCDTILTKITVDQCIHLVHLILSLAYMNHMRNFSVATMNDEDIDAKISWSTVGHQEIVCT